MNVIKYYPIDYCDKQYIHFTNFKKPYTNAYSVLFDWQNANTFVDGAAIWIPEGMVVLDFDDDDDFAKVVEILNAYNIRPPIMKSDYGVHGGGHIWFRTETQFKDQANAFLPIMLQCDIKCWGVNLKGERKKNAAIVKLQGRWRRWLQTSPTFEDVPELPFWLTPTPASFSSLTLEDFNEGERNSNLFRLIFPLATRFNFSHEQIHDILDIINRFLLDEPLPENEIEAMFSRPEDYALVLDEAMKMNFFDEKDHFLHAKFAQYLISTFHITKYNGQLWTYENRGYIAGDENIKGIIRDLLDFLKVNQINEVMRYLHEKRVNEIKSLTPWISLNNGLLNTETFEFVEHTPEIFCPVKLDITLRDANEFNGYDWQVIHWIHYKIMEILSFNQGQYNFLMEIIGYCFVPHTLAQKSFIFYGDGANGKSIILESLIRPLFQPYDSSLSLEELNDRFRASGIVGKLVNIDPDKNNFTMKDVSKFKKLTTGDKIPVEKKFQDSFEIYSTTKLIIGTNHLPKSNDTTSGFFRRIAIMNFKEVFNEKNGNYNPKLASEIHTHIKVIKDWLLIESLNGLMRLKDNGWNFSQSDLNLDLVQEMQRKSNSVYAWIRDNGFTIAHFIDQPLRQIYYEYEQWCDDNDIFKISKYTFSQKVREEFGLKTKTKRVPNQVSPITCFVKGER